MCMGSPELSSLREKFRRPKSNCQDLFHNYPPKMVIYTVDADGRAVLKFGHKIHMRLYHAMMGERPQRMRIFFASVPVAPSGARNGRLNQYFTVEAQLTQENAMRENRVRGSAQRIGGWCEPKRKPDGVSFPSGIGEATVADHGRPRYRPWICWNPRESACHGRRTRVVPRVNIRP